MLRVTDQEYVFSLTVSFVYNRQELCSEWENRKVYKKKWKWKGIYLWDLISLVNVPSSEVNK